MTSFSELRQALESDALRLGVAKDHAKDWWTMGEESPSRPLAALFLYLPLVGALAIAALAFTVGRYTWLIAIPFGLLTMFFGSPLNPARFMAVLFGLGLVVAGWVAGWSSLVVSGITVLAIYIEMQIYYGLGKRLFRRFLYHDEAGFVKYWNGGIVQLLNTRTGEIHHHG